MILLLANVLMQGLFIGSLALIHHQKTKVASNFARVRNNTMTVFFKKTFFNLVSDFDLNLPRSIRVFEASSHERKSGEVLPVQPVPCNGRNNMISHDISQDNDIVWWCIFCIFTLSHCAHAIHRKYGDLKTVCPSTVLDLHFAPEFCAVYSFGPWSPCPRVSQI